jgi:eukaryotic-like serine/threonine-protein kinase
MKINRYCPKCGAACELDDRYCMHCRAALPPTTSGRRAVDPLDQPATEFGLAAGHILASRFEIQRVLGVGGMGRVHLAVDKVLDRQAAVKVLWDVLSHDTGSVRRLVEEAKAAIRLAHPNIVRLDDYHDDGNVKFLTMGFVEGESLARLCPVCVAPFSLRSLSACVNRFPTTSARP